MITVGVLGVLLESGVYSIFLKLLLLGVPEVPVELSMGLIRAATVVLPYLLELEWDLR